jgi:hypothetical protein
MLTRLGVGPLIEWAYGRPVAVGAGVVAAAWVIVVTVLVIVAMA